MLCIEDTCLYSVVFLVTYIDETEGIGCYAPWIIKFPIGGALRAKRSEESARWIQDLNPMIISVCYDILADTVYRHTG